MQQRYYEPQIGRFLSVDPVAAREGGDNFNRYAYAFNNPYKFTDPDGRDGACANSPGACGMRPLTRAESQRRDEAYAEAGTAAVAIASVLPATRGAVALVKVLSSNKSDGRPNGVPKDWVAEKPAKGPGTIYGNPENPKHDTVRAVPGCPESSQPGQQTDHVVRTANGARYGEANTPVPTKSTESHVSPEKFKFVPADKLPKP